MRKEIIEKILEEWNVCSCDNSALADRLLKEFSPAGDYIKKSEALSKANYYETGLTTGFEYVTTKDLNSLPTYHIAEMATSGEYIRKADMERILCSTNNAVRIGEEFLELPTYAIPDSAENKGHWKVGFGNTWCSCSECSGNGSTNWSYCPWCGADMRGESDE